MKNRLQSRSGTTLIEVLIAVTLLGLLSVGILMALRVGLGAMGSANKVLMENRRVAGAQRILEQEIAGFMPLVAPCAPEREGGGGPFPFFQGEPQAMRFVSTFSLQEAWRGAPHILEFQVIRGENGRGVRLIVNEVPYTGPFGAGLTCLGRVSDPQPGLPVLRFRPIEPGPRSFVLADKLLSCQFFYQAPPAPPTQPVEFWTPFWVLPQWPRGVRVEMVPMDDDNNRLRPLSVTAPIRVNRSPEIHYVDY